MTDDDLTQQLAQAISEAFPELDGTLERVDSRSLLNTPVYILRWQDEPSMAAVRAWLDASPFRAVSVQFGKRAGES